MTRELSAADFQGTFSTTMANITETAEPVVDIWEYVEELVAGRVVSEYVYTNELVEAVYGNETNTYHHILLPTESPKRFVVIVVSLSDQNITGHFILNVSREYGIE